MGYRFKNKRLDYLFFCNDNVDFFVDALFRLLESCNDFIEKNGSVPHVISDLVVLRLVSRRLTEDN